MQRKKGIRTGSTYRRAVLVLADSIPSREEEAIGKKPILAHSRPARFGRQILKQMLDPLAGEKCAPEYSLARSFCPSLKYVLVILFVGEAFKPLTFFTKVFLLYTYLRVGE